MLLLLLVAILIVLLVYWYNQEVNIMLTTANISTRIVFWLLLIDLCGSMVLLRGCCLYCIVLVHARTIMMWYQYSPCT